MTNQEAIKVLNCTSLLTFCLCKVAIDGKMLSMKEALGMGIEALENQKTGRWIRKNDICTSRVQLYQFECSNCREINTFQSNYCPCCGAKMEGDK